MHARSQAVLKKKQLDRVKRTINRARLAGCAPAIEQTIWRAATYTQEERGKVSKDSFRHLVSLRIV